MNTNEIDLYKKQINAIEIDLAELEKHKLSLTEKLEQMHFQQMSLKSYRDFLLDKLTNAVKHAYH